MHLLQNMLGTLALCVSFFNWIGDGRDVTISLLLHLLKEIDLIIYIQYLIEKF